MSWIEQALNGTSVRVPLPWDPRANDLLAGEIVEVRERSHATSQPCTILVIRVEAGTLGGEPLEQGAWFELDCKCAILRRWLERDKPTAGTKVAIQFRGRSRGELDYVAGVAPDAVSAGAGWGAPAGDEL